MVPQTRVSEKPYKVWVCLNNLASCEILIGECSCIAGYNESCKHVFALLHYVEHMFHLVTTKLARQKSKPGTRP